MSNKSTDSDLPGIITPDPQLLAEQIYTILTDPDLNSLEKNTSLLHITVGLVGGVAAVFYKSEENGLRSVGQLLSPQAASLSSDVLAEMRKGAVDSLQKKRSTILPLAMAPQAHIFSCPVFSVQNGVPVCLSVLILPENKKPEPFLVVLQLMAVALGQVKSSNLHDQGSLLHLLAASGKQIDSLRAFGDVIRQSASCSLLAIGSISGGKKVRLEHVSDVVSLDIRTDQSRRFLKVMQESTNHNMTGLWPLIEGESNVTESLLIKELVQANGMRQGVSIPLFGGGQFAGVLVLLWAEKLKKTTVLHELSETAVFFGLFVKIFSKRGKGVRLSDIKDKTLLSNKVIAVILSLVFLGIALFPKEFTLHPVAIVKPVQVRYVVARFDGLLQKVFVEPGDRVEKNMELALLDDRELELELRTIRADSAKSLKMRDNYMANGNVAAAQIALLEFKRFQERESLLLGRQQQLSLQSPYSGIVLSGDLKQSEGGPVAKGEVLFEVAPLERVLLQLLVPDRDVFYVRKGAKVNVHFDAFPGILWKGKVARIAPRSERVQGENVFPVSFEIENREGLLLPGMQGYASIYCGKKSLAWVYFHKPWYALRRLLASLL